MKKSFIILMLILMALCLYGAGNTEDPDYKPYYKDLFTGENTSFLTGKLKLANRIMPELIVGNQNYYLMVGPGYIRHHFPEEVKDGKEINVEGYILTKELIEKLKKNIEEYDRGYRFGRRFGLYDEKSSDSLSLIVTSVTIDGKKYNIDNLGYGKGFRRGRFRGRGKGPGHKGGPKYRGKGKRKRKHW